MAETTLRKGKGRPPGFDRETALSRACGVFWRRGFEPATMAELCRAMDINPPSLYAAYGNKVQLFLKAVDFYEKTYWDDTWNALDTEPALHKAFADFFQDAARILTSQSAPCGCLVILGAANVSPEGQAVSEALKIMRDEGKDCLLSRLKRGVSDGELDPGLDIASLALTLNTLLEGMSLQARDGATRDELERIAKMALSLLPAPIRKTVRRRVPKEAPKSPLPHIDPALINRVAKR